MNKHRQLIGWVAIVLLPSYVLAATDPERHYSPYAGEAYPAQVYWGDTHLHTNLSYDANLFGNVANGHETAYRAALGETVMASSGQLFRLKHPLDFVVIADHAQFLGVFAALRAGDQRLLSQPEGQRVAAILKKAEQEDGLQFLKQVMPSKDSPLQVDGVVRDTWRTIAQTADRYNQPGKFTAFIGFEWTSMPGGNNLHRNVIFRDGAKKAMEVAPFSALDSDREKDLWQYLQNYEDRTGGKVLAIPHNGNGSNGLMFAPQNRDGSEYTKAEALTRSRWEPLYEVTQIKGDSETHPLLSANDEFADFDRWDRSNLIGTAAKEPWMLQYEYARPALKTGFQIEKKIGINPFKFGLIGSTDGHTSIPAVEENNFIGTSVSQEPSASRIKGEVLLGQFTRSMASFSSSGSAAVWASENTREALFDAMQRKETFATTGPRMVVRFFGGWGFAPGDDLRPDYDRIGYQIGVPMGGDLYRPEKSADAPSFLIVASKAPGGANLDRIQVVKGWLNGDGTTEEKVYNVSVSDNRPISNNQVKALQSTVDVATASYTNTVGAVQLSTVWRDPDFDPSQQAFYYLRVLEIPTPRWTTYDAVFFATDLPEGVPPVIQERAYTSPIWYNPGSGSG